jgi:putative transposase
MQKREGKWYVRIEIDEEVKNRMVGNSRRNPIAAAHWVHVKCKYCGSLNVFRFGFDRKGNQRYICKDCQHTFTDTGATPGMRYPVEVIASALNQYYEGMSLHAIQRQLKLDYGVMPDHTSIYDWVVRYSKKAVSSLAGAKPKVGNVWVADETVLKLKSGGGQNVWMFDCIDEDTRFMLASHISLGRYMRDAQRLMEKAQKRADKIPKVMLTDKLRSYLDAIERAWGADTRHVQSSPFEHERSTRAIERLHGTIKDRTKIMRGLGNRDTAQLVMDGWEVHYNFFRPHMGLGGQTPAQAAKIKSPFESWADVVRGK